MQFDLLRKTIQNGEFDDKFCKIYVCKKEACPKIRERYITLLDTFAQQYGENRDCMIFSAPGRTEVGGNHTDHQHGCVLAASVNLDVIAVVAKNNEGIIRVKSFGYKEDVIDLKNLDVQENEKNHSASLIRGLAAHLRSLGCPVQGFDACTTSDVLSGSGLSSSAAFEVLIGTIMNSIFGGNLNAVQIAQAGQYAENVYFGKPCGLMDQAASSVGSFVAFDFNDPKNPKVEKIPFDFDTCGYSLCIVDSRASHADLTDDYSAIPNEMCAAAKVFGKNYLREVSEDEFYNNLPQVRKQAGDRATLRAIHYFADNKKAIAEAESLKKGDFDTFRSLIISSGNSSYKYLQNVYSSSYPDRQAVSFVLALCERFLSDKKGAWRVHGGGFAGTVQAFVPNEYLEEFKNMIDKNLGKGACHVLKIRPVGGYCVTK